MPRGIPGSGPNARKRLQRQFAQPETTYMNLPLSEDETKAAYVALQNALKENFGTQAGFHLSNVTYRITEYVMLDKLGLPKKEPSAAAQAGDNGAEPPKRRRRGRGRRRGSLATR